MSIRRPLPFRTELARESVQDLLQPDTLARFRDMDNPLVHRLLADDERAAWAVLDEVEGAHAADPTRHRTFRWRKEEEFDPRFDLRLNVVLYARAVGSARRSGHFWNPLLDRFVAMGMNAYQADTANEGSYEGVANPFGEQTHAAASWVEAQADPRDLEALLVFQNPSIGDMVATRARVLDRGLIMALLERHPNAAGSLLRNECFDAALIREFADCVVHRVESGYSASGWGWRLDPPMQALRDLRDSGMLPLRDPLWDRLAAAVSTAPVGQDLEATGEPGEPEIQDRAWFKAALWLASAPDAVVPRRREAAYRGVRDVPDLAKHFLLGHAATRAMLQDGAAACLGDPEVEAYLLDKRSLKGDAEVRAALAASPHAATLERLLYDAEGDEVRHIFKAVARLSADALNGVVSEHFGRLMRALHFEDVAPLLASEDADVRLLGLRMAGRLKRVSGQADAPPVQSHGADRSRRR